MPRPLEWTEELVTAFWDHHAQRPETYFTYQHGRSLVRLVRPALAGAQTIVDYGCGAGFLIDSLLEAGATSVTGADISPASVRATAQRFDGRRGFAGAGTIDDLRSSGQRFDALFCCEVVEHLYDEQLEPALDDLAALTRPGGRLVITTPNDEDLAASEVYCPVADVTFHRWQHVRSWDVGSLTEALARHGIRVDRAHTVDIARTWPVNRAAHLADRARGALGRGAKPPHLVVLATNTGS